MRVPALLVALLLLSACSGTAEEGSPDGDGTTSRSEKASGKFDAVGCPVDDREFCERAAAAANALMSGDVQRLVLLSRRDEFQCDDLPSELFVDCKAGQVLDGYAFFTGDFRIRILSRAEYRRRIEELIGHIDETYSDAHGSGALRIRGIRTCGPPDPDRRSYHLAFTGAVRSEPAAASERWLGSLEFAHRDGNWSIGIVYAASVSAWEAEYEDPFAETACGNVERWTPT